MGEAHNSETDMVNEEEEVKMKMEKEKKRRDKRKKKLLMEAEKAKNRGVCYLSRIPPKMEPSKIRHLLSPYGEVLRIYLAPEDPTAQMRRKRSGGFRGQGFSEGWVEFADKRIAKRTAKLLNGEQIGGKKRSQFYFDIWNIKYLSKFKWDDLTEENASRNAIREQKLRMELSAAKKERDHYLKMVDESRGISEIEKRMKRKAQNDLDSESPKDQRRRKIRHFPQKKPLAETAEESQNLSKDILAEIFNTGNDEA